MPTSEDPTQSGKSWDVGKITNWSQRYLQEKGFATPRLDSELLLAKTLDLSRVGLYTQYDRPITANEQKYFGSLLRRRLQGEPIAYLLGSKDFMGHSFAVGPEVLIPRPETELLVEQAIAYLHKRHEAYPDEKLRVLDVGSGSGCIAISIAKACSFVEVVAWDICEKALSIACANARRLGVGHRVGFYCVDALALEAWQAAGSFALLISNPPYIRTDEMEGLEVGVKNYEPHRALVGGADGLVFYRVMAQQAMQVLAPGGQLMWEIGAEQGPTAQQLLQAAGWHNIRVEQDYAHLDRMVFAQAASQ